MNEDYSLGYEDGFKAGQEDMEKQEKALQALHDENERLQLYKEAYAQPDENRSALSLYESGFIDGREKGLKEAQRTWVGLTDDDVEMLVENKCADPSDQIRFVEAKLKEKNT